MISGKPEQTPLAGPRIITVASGKGGVGKSNIAGNLAVLMALRGKRVLLFDADLSLANVDVLFGMTPQVTIGDVLIQGRDLKDAIIPGPGGIDVLPASSGLSSLSNLSEDEMENLRDSAQKAFKPYDIVMIDAPSGIATNMQFVCDLASELLLLTTPEPTSVMDAYAVVKLISMKKSDMRISLVVNMVSDLDTGERISSAFNQVTGHFLHRNVPTIAKLPFDPCVLQAVRRQQPYTLLFPDCPASHSLRGLRNRLLAQGIHQQRNGFEAVAGSDDRLLKPTFPRWPDPMVG